jgi:hypothetical protein
MNPILKAILERGSRSTTKPDKAKAIGFDPERKFYHGTNAPDIQEFDLDKVDVGVHIAPDYETATNRLLDTRQGKRANSRLEPTVFEEGANIIPLHARMNKTLETVDAGDWADSHRAAQTIADAIQEYYGDPADYGDAVDILENIRFSDNNKANFATIREVLNKLGFDSIKYENYIEGMGRGSLPKVNDYKESLMEQIQSIKDMGWKRRQDYITKNRPDFDPLNRQAEYKFMKELPDTENFLKIGEKEKIAKLEGQLDEFFVADPRYDGVKYANPKYTYDPFSYIIMNPADLRATTAKFDPKMSKSASLTAGQAALGAGGILGALGLPEDATAADIATAGMKIAPKEEAQGEFQQMILDALLGFMAPTPMGDATMDAYNRNRIR